MTRPSSTLSMQVTTGRGFVDLVVAGELDLATTGSLRQLLARVERIDAPWLVHLRDVDFVDSTGLEPLIDTARHRRVHAAASVRICDVSPSVQRMLRLVGSTDTALDPQAWDAFCESPRRGCDRAGATRGVALVTTMSSMSTWSRSQSVLHHAAACLGGERWAY